MTGQVGHTACHLFDIEYFGPVFVSFSFAFLHFGLTVNEQTNLALHTARLIWIMDTKTIQNLTDRFLCVCFAQRIHTDKTLAIRGTEAGLFSALDLPSCLFKHPYQRLKTVRTFLKNLINSKAQMIPCRKLGLIALPTVIICVMHPGIADNRQLMFHADLITQSGQSFSRAQEVPELMLAIQRCGTEYDVIMDMRLICVRCYDISMIPFKKTAGKLISDLVCFFRRDFTWFKRLAKLICNYFTFSVSARDTQICFPHEFKLIGSSLRVTSKPRYQLTILRFFRIGCIIHAGSHASACTLAFANMHSDQPSSSHSDSSTNKKRSQCL